jgi:ComF family protein
MFENLQQYTTAFGNIVFPNGCYMCDRNLIKGENGICTYCKISLPKTHFQIIEENAVIKHLWGKANIVAATAFLHFIKGSGVQEAIHQLKYKGKKQVGVVLGEWFGHDLIQSEPYASADFLVPVPLHSARFHSRGYNQSEMIANGMSHAMKIPVEKSLLQRGVETQTQTRKHRYERFENMKDVFLHNDDEKFHNKKYLIIDDVLTTGSTIAACAEVLNLLPGAKVMVATLAFANR